MLIPMSDLAICPGNCSGKGVCLSGTCLCEVIIFFLKIYKSSKVYNIHSIIFSRNH